MCCFQKEQPRKTLKRKKKTKKMDIQMSSSQQHKVC